MIVIKNVKNPDGTCTDIQMPGDCDKIIDGTKLTILPALIDPHVHFRTPGPEHKENWISAAQACVASGITTVFDMPNNQPSCTTLDALMDKHRLIQSQLDSIGIPLRYCLYFGADRRYLKEIPKAKKYAIGIKIFMGSSTGNLLIDDEPALDEIFRMAADLDMIVSVHAEDESIIRRNMKFHADCTDPSVHSIIRAREAAAKAVERALSLALKHKTRLCVLHVSTKEEIWLLRQGKASGINVYGEVAPHHLLLSTADYGRWGTRVQVNPPLREAEDQEVLWRALNDGTLDFIGTDHAPHTLKEKNQPYGSAPSGIPGIELLLPLLLDAVNKEKITLKRMVEVTRTNIERIFRLPGNGDSVLVDLKKIKVVQDGNLYTKCGWSPYCGRSLQGWPEGTILQGKLFNLQENNANKPTNTSGLRY